MSTFTNEKFELQRYAKRLAYMSYLVHKEPTILLIVMLNGVVLSGRHVINSLEQTSCSHFFIKQDHDESRNIVNHSVTI